jgi:hypothetical protein
MNAAKADLIKFAATKAGEKIAQRLEATGFELGFALVVFEHGAGDAMYVANVGDDELQPVLEGLARMLELAANTTPAVMLEHIDKVKSALLASKCSQCGQPFAEAACGPTHAAIAAQASTTTEETAHD